jgi:hypothetical protein
MLVSRSDVSLRVSIHRESRVTGANAMSASLDGSGPGSLALRMNLSRSAITFCPGRAGFHRVAGARSDSNFTFLGPVRRSSIEAIDLRQLAAAIFRSASVIVTCASFSASAKVAGETSGPTSGAVPNVGGAPGGGVVVDFDSDFWPWQAATVPRSPSGARIRNWRRVFTDFQIRERLRRAILVRFRNHRIRLRPAGDNTSTEFPHDPVP